MLYAKLKPFADKYDNLEPLLKELAAYLQKMSAKAEDFRHVVPVLLAEELDIEEETALVLLYFAYRAGIIEPYFVAYSPDHWYLDRFPSRETPEELYCQENDTYYSIDEYYVELLFEFSNPPPSISLN